MTRLFEYVCIDPDTKNNPVTFRCTEDFIIATYWPWWRDRMTEKGDVPCKYITKEACIEDWMAVHYAKEIK